MKTMLLVLVLCATGCSGGSQTEQAEQTKSGPLDIEAAQAAWDASQKAQWDDALD